MEAHPLRCRCGRLRGSVTPARSTQRVVCCCRDCRAYACHLGGGGVLDAQGGTEIVASLPSKLRFDAGNDTLACLSLSPRGLLRWYARCCGTPIGNTPRNPKLAYVGLVHSCLEQDAPSLQHSFGPLRMVVNAGGAPGGVRKSPALAAAAGLAGMAAMLLGARLGGGWRDNPFFEAGTAAPVRTVHVLTPAERTQAYAAADRPAG
ncbi:MAG TPA: DUF6151 family protein [Rubrivivax sp.]|nr:DUF6151 family protein [Rubrivivax sp.]